MNRTPAPRLLPDWLRALGSHLGDQAADEIERLRMVAGELTAAKSRAVSQRGHARHKKRRAQILVAELRDQNRRLVAELLAYRAEDGA